MPSDVSNLISYVNGPVVPLPVVRVTVTEAPYNVVSFDATAVSRAL